MKVNIQYSIKAILLITIVLVIHPVKAQVGVFDEQVYEIMDRGMMHNAVYNSGMIGQAWNLRLTSTNIPLMEWPPRSAFTYNAIEYSGFQNSVGAGVYVSANEDGKWGVMENTNRLASFAGAIGKSKNNEPPWGKWTYPISGNSISVEYNLPLNEDGTLNPNYNPDEAEKIVTTRWAMSDSDKKRGIGITVTRVSRQWSFPDYDDIIIHEYNFENTGDLTGDGVTDTVRTLVDVIVQFVYGFCPSMYGSQRYNSYYWEIRENQTSFWDPAYWMQYNQVINVLGDTLLAGRPEPDPANFELYSQTGLYGGGLMSPAAPGFAMLYYDTSDKLEIIDYDDSTRNQSYQAVKYDLIEKRDSTGYSYNLDENDRPLQPWSAYNGKDPTHLAKIWDKIHRFDDRSGKLYPTPEDNDDNAWVPGPEWIGRLAPINEGGGDKDNDHPMRSLTFGPYRLEHGESIKFAVAEVIGYGAKGDHYVVGGLETGPEKQPIKATSWHKHIRVSQNGQTAETMDYLNDYGYPDYVNSPTVRTVQDAAHKAFEAYTGKTIPLPEEWTPGNPGIWPEDNPSTGLYNNIPIPIPAPVTEIVSTATGEVSLTWGKDVEQFESTFPTRVTGHLAEFNIYRADYKMGPWKLLGSVEKGNVNGDGLYEFLDSDRSFKIEETKYYAVTSVDEFGNESGKTNFTELKKTIGAVEKLGKVYVVPNPFILNSGFVGEDAERMLGFYGLPRKCTIYVFSFSGQRVMTIDHDEPVYSNNWKQVTINHQDLASGLYYFVVTTPEGDKSTGKFIVIK